MVRHGETPLLSPGTYVAAPLPARRRPDPGTGQLAVRLAGMIHERGKQPAELGRMPRAQVDLVVGAVHAEPDGLVRRAASEIVLQKYFDPLHYFPPSCGLR